MSRLRRLRSVATVAALLSFTFTPARAHADPNNGPSDASWGWTTLALAVAVGGSLTGVSMAIDCHNDLECARWTSLGIWGGIAIASAGTAAGLIMVKAASRPPRVRVSFTVDRSQPGSSMPRASFVYTF